VAIEIEQLIDQGNSYRAQHRPDLALQCYAQALIAEPTNAAAFNNFGIVLRESGQPVASIPFLEQATRLQQNYETAEFNLAVSILLSGDLDRGFKQYESRWNFEHLKGTLPDYAAPRWSGEDLQGKTILVICEQGLGDNIQFSRYTRQLYDRGATVIFKLIESMHSLYKNDPTIDRVISNLDREPDPPFDYWSPVMSLPRILGVTYDNMNSPIRYIKSDRIIVEQWRQRLGEKTRPRIGFSWSGRRDSWINQHKAVDFMYIAALIKRNPQYEWINLQIDANTEESAILSDLGCATYPGTITSMADTAALMECADLIISVDTAVTHLSCAIGRPTWVMLSNYALDWRWLLNRSDSPWYPTARLFRQPSIDRWAPVILELERELINHFG